MNKLPTLTEIFTSRLWYDILYPRISTCQAHVPLASAIALPFLGIASLVLIRFFKHSCSLTLPNPPLAEKTDDVGQKTLLNSSQLRLELNKTDLSYEQIKFIDTALHYEFEYISSETQLERVEKLENIIKAFPKQAEEETWLRFFLNCTQQNASRVRLFCKIPKIFKEEDITLSLCKDFIDLIQFENLVNDLVNIDITRRGVVLTALFVLLRAKPQHLKIIPDITSLSHFIQKFFSYFDVHSHYYSHAPFILQFIDCIKKGLLTNDDSKTFCFEMLQYPQELEQASRVCLKWPSGCIPTLFKLLSYQNRAETLQLLDLISSLNNDTIINLFIDHSDPKTSHLPLLLNYADVFSNSVFNHIQLPFFEILISLNDMPLILAFRNEELFQSVREIPLKERFLLLQTLKFCSINFIRRTLIDLSSIKPLSQLKAEEIENLRSSHQLIDDSVLNLQRKMEDSHVPSYLNTLILSNRQFLALAPEHPLFRRALGKR